MANVFYDEKIVPEGWSSRTVNALGPVMLFQNMADLDNALVKMEESLNKVPLGGIGFSTKVEEVGTALDYYQKLLQFVDYLPYELEELIDDKFYKQVHNGALEYLATIDADKLTTRNNIGLTATSYEADGYGSTVNVAHLKLGDFVGYNVNGAYEARQKVEGFTQLFKEKYDALMASGMEGVNPEEIPLEDFLKSMVPGEFQVEKIVPWWLKLLDMASDILIIPAIIDASLGYDWITGDHLTNTEAGFRMVTALVNLISLGQAAYAAESIKQLGKILLVGVISDLVASGTIVLGEALELPPAVTALLALFAGIGAGKISTDMLFGNPQNLSALDLEALGDDIARVASDNNMTTDDLIRLLQKDPGSLTAAQASIIDDVFRRIDGIPSSNSWNIQNNYPADTANQWWRDMMGYDNPPYKPGTDVSEIVLTQDTTFVRVYDGTTSHQAGGWLMRAEDIQGLSPRQIQDKFALPTTPQYITDVTIPSGTTLRTGTVNPVDGWGSGGGIQYDLMGQRIGDFTNARPLE